jgi:hypothetical protein
VKRQAVGHLCKAHGVSQRRACAALDVDRSTVRYRSRRPDDGELRDAIKWVARKRRRFGCRRIQVMLERVGKGLHADKGCANPGLIFARSCDQVGNARPYRTISG